jgi:hypothetical protein
MKYLDLSGNTHNHLAKAYFSDVVSFCSRKVRDLISAIKNRKEPIVSGGDRNIIKVTPKKDIVINDTDGNSPLDSKPIE